MDTELLSKKFGQMGARVKVVPFVSNIYRRDRGGIDIKADAKGEYFDIRVETNDNIDYEVIDTRPDLRHLLLMARRDRAKQKFLCGHDERHWFVCAVPGDLNRRFTFGAASGIRITRQSFCTSGIA